jgi:MFS transporter, CP family, cyanate transporter
MGDTTISRRDAALIAIVAAAFNVRIAVVAVGPLLSRIRADTGMSSVLAGVLGALPFLCMGVFAQTGVRLIRRWGERCVIFLSLALIVAATLARAAMPTALLIVVATVPLGVGIALIGLSLPSVIKRSFPARAGAATGLYTASQAVGSSIVALTMVPLARALGGWRWAFALSVLPTLIALPLWLLLPKDGWRSQARPGLFPRRGALRVARARPRFGFERPRLGLPFVPVSQRGLLLAGVFGLQSMCYAGMINWLATVCTHTGWTAGDAGVATAAVSLLMIPAALIVPGRTDGRDRARWLLGTAVVMGIGIAGLAITPTNAPWVWIVAFSLGSGALFPLVLTLPLDLGAGGPDITELTAEMLGYGYLVSATGPLLVGGLYGLTGGFVVPLMLLAVLGTCSGVLALAPQLRPQRRVVAPAPAPVVPAA